MQKGFTGILSGVEGVSSSYRGFIGLEVALGIKLPSDSFVSCDFTLLKRVGSYLVLRGSPQLWFERSLRRLPTELHGTSIVVMGLTMLQPLLYLWEIHNPWSFLKGVIVPEPLLWVEDPSMFELLRGPTEFFLGSCAALLAFIPKVVKGISPSLLGSRLEVTSEIRNAAQPFFYGRHVSCLDGWCLSSLMGTFADVFGRST
ncbi:hypothetical protein Salat_1662700 [Sesamum alatum]|uniref:Uncharacterized protein n=1 Tax=Sesamum alatum TaxID=300844 RepID=A0AAE1Y6M7_9LAMI|nr:hypothetical protein Salat_1662700 [Sesamum alatum]